jgi:hypothetical protein
MREILGSARGQAAIILMLTVAANGLGLPFTEDMLASVWAKAAALGGAGLGLWSLFQRNKITPQGIGFFLQRRTWLAILSGVTLVSQIAGHKVDEAGILGMADQIPLLLSTVLAVVSRARGDSAATLALRARVGA